MDCTGKTKNLGVIGYPIEHSLSPVIQNAAIAAAGIDYAYVAMPVAPEDLKSAVAGLKAIGFCGFNVTIPHKVAIMQYLDEIDASAKLIGAVNTVHIKDGKLYGYNTDGTGFINSLLRKGVVLQDKTAVLFGAGGACRAIICGLIQNGVKHIVLGVRNQAKGAKLVAVFDAMADVKAYDWHDKAFAGWLQKADLLINTTPLGMHPKVDDMPPVDWMQVKPTAFVCDVIYTPAETKFLQQASQHGHEILNGEGMLAEQGAAALRIWTGADIDADIMAAVLHDYLNKIK